MSYKLNQADPTRRARLLARRAGHPRSGQMVEDERDSHGHLVLKRDRTRPPAYGHYGTPMKISRRNAMVRYMRAPYQADLMALTAAIQKAGKDAAPRPPIPKHIQELEDRCSFVMYGYASRIFGYGFHPTRGG